MKVHNLSDYGVIRQVYGGGFTKVLVARGPDDERVVIRKLKKEMARKRRLRSNFSHGRKVQEHFSHPHIPKIIGHGSEHHIPFIIMEYIEAQTLRELVSQKSAILKNHPLNLIRQLAETIQYIHNSGWLHLDIKPENILITEDNNLYLLDYDLARKHHHKAVKLRCIAGTRSYIAPEIHLSKSADIRADVFSFGVVCYEILTGRRPFADFQSRLQYKINTTPTPVRKLNPDAGARLELMVHNCIAQDAALRYPSMSSILRELKNMV